MKVCVQNESDQELQGFTLLRFGINGYMGDGGIYGRI